MYYPVFYINPPWIPYPYRSARFALIQLAALPTFVILRTCNSRKRVKPQSSGKKKISLHLIPLGCFKTNVLSDLRTCPISLRNQDRNSVNGCIL